MRDLYEHRNRALHGAEARYDQPLASLYRSRLDAVIRATIDWVLASRAASIKDLDAAIESLPAA